MSPNQASRLSRIVDIAVSKLAASKDQVAFVSEIAEWSGLTLQETVSAFRSSGVVGRRTLKGGVRGCAYSRLELVGLSKELEAAVMEAARAPTRTWGCTDCFERWESNERQPVCPECGGAETKLAPPSRAPATRSEATASTDATLRDVIEGAGLTDYTNQRPLPVPIIQSPTGPVTMAPMSAAGADVGAALGGAPGKTMFSLNPNAGPSKINPALRANDVFGKLPPRRPTAIVARDTRPLPPPV